MTGKAAEDALGQAAITVNKNAVPFDTLGPAITSGIRIGTPAITTRGMKETEMAQIADMILSVLKNMDDPAIIQQVKDRVDELCEQFPIEF